MKSNKCGRLIALFMLTLVLAVAFTVTASATTTDVLDIDAISHDGECGNVSISWNEVSDADYYIVYLDGIHVAYTYKTSYSFTDFVVGESHTFRVVARKGNQVSADGEIVVSATHNYTSVVTLPDCVNGGYTTYTCDCDYTYVGDNVDPLGHAPEADDGDCTTEIKCTRCGTVTTPAKPHAPEADDGDCTTEIKCADCGTVTTPAKPHTPEADDGDCTTEIKCADCGTVTTPASSGHIWIDATCITLKTCSVCSTTEGNLNTDNHAQDPVWTIKDSQGHESKYPCCGETRISASPHDWEDGVCTTCNYACVHESTDDGDCTTAVNCSICGKETTPAGVHIPEADDGDCTTEVKCLSCGTVTTPAQADHTPEDDDGDCTTARDCTVCGKEVIPAKPHTPEADDGDCTTAINCTVCGTVTTPAQADHTPEADDGDCTTAVNCTVCGKELTPAKNHTPATDDNDCTTAVNCTVCGKEVIPAKPHTPEADDNECTTALNCTVCGKEITPAKNHTPEADDGDCTTAVNCTVCGKVVTPANNHTPEEDDGDCTTAVNCTVCGTVVEPARAAHSGGNATCSTLASCEVCGTKYGSFLSNNHEQTAEWHKDADSHYSIYNCCGKYYQSETPHNWKNGVCDTEGCGYACQHPDMTYVNTATTHTYTCGICDYSVTEGHSFNDTVIEPTCTTGGYTTHKCECGYEYTDSKTEATGHDWSGLDGVCATCSAKCSHPEERAIEGKEPTCNEGGYTGYHHCDACGADYDKEELEALPHNYGFDAFSISPNPNADTTEPGTKIYLKYACTNEDCHDEKFSIPVGVKLNDSQKQLTLKVIVVVLALIVVFWAWRALKAPATTTPWWRRRR